MARPRKNPLTVINVCEHCGNEFEIKYQKRTQRFCCKKCSNASPDTKRKIVESQKKTYMENYGVEHPMKTEKTVENFKKSMKKKYGVEHALQKEEFLEKSKNTKLEKYGDENYNNVEQIKQTCLERYGVENPRQTEEYIEKYYSTCQERYNTDHASKSKAYRDTHRDTFFEKLETSERFSNFTALFTKEDYEGFTGKYIKKYPFKCKRCGNISTHNISGGRSPQCPKCDRKYSKFQTEVLEFVNSIDNSWRSNDRQIISPLEIDIVSETHKLGIECDSLLYHSEVFGKKNKLYHVNKTKLSTIKGFQLLHIWDFEWIGKQEIVKSIILNHLNKTPRTIYGRECVVKELSPNITKDFLLKNHIQGKDKSSIKLGLYHNDELVSVMTFYKSRFDKRIQYELSRFCNKTNTSVVGGASKLFKHFVKYYDPKSVVTYSDRRYFSGQIYQTLGFNFVDLTRPTYRYILNNYTSVISRINYRKSLLKEKLPSFDESLSEWENMKNNGFDRIWDCGNSKWIYSSIK